MEAGRKRGLVMVALTVCQPWAGLIALPDDNPLAKRIENRTWRTRYRGPLAIHAGASRKWLRRAESLVPAVEPITFSAVIAVAELVDCLHIDDVRSGRVPAAFEWVAGHRWIEGPWCWVLADVRRLETPVPCKGKLGLWPWQAACFPA